VRPLGLSCPAGVLPAVTLSDGVPSVATAAGTLRETGPRTMHRTAREDRR